jgi:hypothetical protein
MGRIFLPIVGFAPIMLFGCTLPTVQSTPAPNIADQPLPAPPPQPKQVYHKEGATNEDFQRAKARCLIQAETAKSASNDPNPFARAGTWVLVYRACMRADGWILVQQ